MILEALKTKTSVSHYNVEVSPLLQPIGTRTLTPKNYTQILRKFYGFFQPLEAKIKQLAQIEQYIPDLSARRKSSLLVQDLQRVTGQQVVLDLLPVCHDLPDITTINDGLGALYVMEGSTLGGKFIAKVVHETLGYTPENGLAFFSGYGAQTGPKWKTFQEALVQYAVTPALGTAVVVTADTTFKKLEKWFNS